MSTAIEPTERTDTRTPGWGEIVAGLVLMGVAVYRLPPVIHANAAHLGRWADIALLALPAVAAMSGFFAAARVRSLDAVGIRRASAGSLVAGAGLGALALVVTVAVTALAPLPLGAPQPDTTVLGLLVLGLAIPVTQELLLRGVVTTALLKYGPLAAVLGSVVLSVAAAVLVRVLLPTASVGVVSAGIIAAVAAVLLVRTGSVWPGIVAHAVCNSLALAVVVLT